MKVLSRGFHERRLLAAALLYRKGRRRVIWVNGVLYCGGLLFALYNLLDYLIEPHAPATQLSVTVLAAALALSLILGYIYGRYAWRNLTRIFGTPAELLS